MKQWTKHLIPGTHQTSLLALSIDSHQITVARVVRDRNGCRMTKSLTVSLPGESFSGEPEPAGIALGAALREAGFKEKRCVVCVPPSWLLTTRVPLPALDADALIGFLSLRAEQEFPLPASELHCAHSAYETSEGRFATLAALPDKRMQALTRLLQTAGLSAQSLSPGLNTHSHAESDKGHLEFRVVDRHVDLIAFADNGVAELRSLVAGNSDAGTAFTFDTDTLNRELRITLGRLPAEIQTHLRKAVFSGSSSDLAEVRDALIPAMNRHGIQVHEQEADPQPMTAAVIATRRILCELPVIFEFIPPKVGRIQQWSGRLSAKGPRRVALVAGAAILLLSLVTWMGRGLYESHLAKQWNRISAEVGVLEENQSDIRRFRSWTATRAESLEILNLVTGTFPDQGDLWVSRLEIDEDRKVSIIGFAQQQESLSIMRRDLLALSQVAEATLEQQRGHAPIQYEIGFQWKGQAHD